MTKTDPLLKVQDLVVLYGSGRSNSIQAVSKINFSIAKGETLGLVGESGCGKSSIARAVMQLPKPTSGSVHFCGLDLTSIGKKKLRQLRPRFQMIFQDSLSAINPLRSIGGSILMPLTLLAGGSRKDKKERAFGMMKAVGLDPDLFNLRPFQLSGGQCQRVQIARALITQPSLLICDEPVSSLDVSIQAQILNLLEDLMQRFGLTMLFISHDMAVVKNLCDRIAVMYRGKICEVAPSEALYLKPHHHYTQTLLTSVPDIEIRTKTCLTPFDFVEFYSQADSSSGCRYHNRCPNARENCVNKEPILTKTGEGRQVACHYPL